MSTPIYNWKRYWCPREGTYNLSDGGYLFDPESEYGRYFNPDLVPFESITTAPCLLLLGEPGIGKSYALEYEFKTNEPKITEGGDHAIMFDLRSYSSEDRLIRELFESPDFIAWKDGGHKLHLFLDSLDECLLRIDTISALLIDKFKKIPKERLHLRIACRTAELPPNLEDGLKRIWGDDSVKVFELVPLTRENVVEAAKTNFIDPYALKNEIERVEVVPFAIKPVTLNFIINTFIESKSLPSKKSDIYSRGCLILCEERNQSRRDSRRTGDFTADQRMVIGARTAALTIFGKRTALWSDMNLGDVPEGDITIQEICGGREVVEKISVEVNDKAIKETLDTGLFTSRGRNRMGWAHQTYAEFLAAWYLVIHNVPSPKILSLIVHPNDYEGKLIPQLHETAAWLADLNPEVFKHIMRVEPEVLLYSNVSTSLAKDKKDLVEALLVRYEDESLIDRDWSIQKRYNKLSHPDLAKQLRPYLKSKDKGIIVRRVAIDIAEACDVKELQGELAAIALDATEILAIRVEAAYAINRIGDGEFKGKLKPLALGQAGEDPNDDLKGNGLKAIWPDHITAAELFSALTLPKRSGYFGAYAGFLSHDLVDSLQSVDLPEALRWTEGQLPIYPLHPFDDVADAILLKAWNHLDLPEVLEGFGRVSIEQLRKHEEIITRESEGIAFRKFLEKEDKKRQLLIEELVNQLQKPEEEWACLLYYRTPIVLNKDVFWLIERLSHSKDVLLQHAWAHLIERLFDLNDPKQVDAVLTAAVENVILAEIIHSIKEPVRLDSQEANNMRKDYRECQKWREKKQERPILSPPPRERIIKLLDSFERGDLSAWWKLNRIMTLKPDSQRFGDEFQSDLISLPGWIAASHDERERIVTAAKKYIFEAQPETEKWFGTKTFYYPAAAGYRAFMLILREDPDYLTNINSIIWGKWSSIIIDYPIYGSHESEINHQLLVKMAYNKSAHEVLKYLISIIDRENREHSLITIINKFDLCFDDRVEEVLLGKFTDEGLKPECKVSLLTYLIDRKSTKTKKYATSLIPTPLPTNGEARKIAVNITCVLMTHTDDAGWDSVWPAIQQDESFCRDVVSQLVDRYIDIRGTIGNNLGVDQLADLYLLLVRLYPFSEDPHYEGAHGVGTRERITDLRESFLHRLKEKGTPEACEAIRKIVKNMPDVKWLKWILIEAKDITRQKTWIPPSPNEIIRMVEDQNARLIQNGDQLISVIIESLKLLELKLQGETPAAIDLWDEKTREPKSEPVLSDYLVRNLKEDLKQRGVVVNREVEIRRGTGGAPGEHTDIHVDAVIKGPNGLVYDSISAIIEVKGCWNPDLKNAMKTQLTDRYLKDNRCPNGLYLVGWFNCPQWDNKDRRKGQVPFTSLEESQKYFEDQANQISQEGILIKAFVINTALR